MRPLDTQPVLIDQAYERLVEAIADGSLKPGQRLRQEDLAELLGVSRQPVSHALQMLRQQRLAVELGRRGLSVAPIEPNRIRDLYQVRTALDALAARLAGDRVAKGQATSAEQRAAARSLEVGLKLGDKASVSALIKADVGFHSALYRLSGNAAITETVETQWTHFKRSMGIVLKDPDRRERIWSEHKSILDRVLAGDAEGAESLARLHTEQAERETSRRLSQMLSAA